MQDGLGGEGSINSVGTYNNGHVQEVVRQAHEELRHLLRQRAEVMRRIGTVKQTIAGLANLFGESVLSEELLELVDRKSNGRQPGFTKACRMILMEAGRAMSARDVCAELTQPAWPFGRPRTSERSSTASRSSTLFLDGDGNGHTASRAPAHFERRRDDRG